MRRLHGSRHFVRTEQGFGVAVAAEKLGTVGLIG